MNLALELNNNTNQIQTQSLDSSQQEQFVFTQPRDPNIVPIVIKQTTLSPFVSKNNETMKIKKMLMPDRNLLQNLFSSSLVLSQMTEQKDMIHVLEVEVVHELINTTKLLI